MKKNTGAETEGKAALPTPDAGGASHSSEPRMASADTAGRQAGLHDRSLFEASPEPAATIGFDGRITDVNAATEVATGLRREELIGTDFSEYFAAPEQARASYQRALKDGVVRDQLLELRQRGGGTIFVLYNASIYKDASGAVAGVFVSARDITARLRVEKQLEFTNRALRATSACNQAIVHARTEADLLNDVCRVVVDVAGYRMAWIGFAQNDADKTVVPVASAGQETGYLHTSRFSWADNAFGRGPTGTAIRTGQTVVCQNMDTDPNFAPWREQARKRGYASSLVLPLSIDGRVRGALSIYAPEPDSFDSGEMKWLAGLGEDIAFGISSLRLRATRERAEQALMRANAYNRSLIEASLDPIVTIGTDGKITDANAAAEAVTGCRRTELIGSDFSDYFTDPAKARAGYQLVFREGFVRDYPLELRHRNGSVISVLYNASVYRNEQGEVIGVSAAARDITERRRAEEKIRRYAAELERSNQELERFAYVASHDLQEPLRTVSSFSELLGNRYRGRLDRDADDFIAFIVGGAKRMQTLINDLLAFSRVGTRGRPFLPVGGEDLLNTALANLRIAVTESQAVITHDPLPRVLADETQIIQVLQNLIGNAIKFRRPAEPPRIHVSARPRDDQWEFSVRDNGIGIDARYFDRIFIIFQRLHGLDQYPGTGIGLAICKKIVERHGGRMRVESEPGHGSTFHFTLPGQPSTP